MTVIDDARYTAEDAILREMFEERKRVFVDLLKWDVPVLVDRDEIGQFDTEDAAYLVITGERGRHWASERLLPTDRPHLLDTIFSALCEGRPPTGPTIMEVSRFCLSRRLTTSERRVARNGLVTALVDHALQQGITAYTARVMTAIDRAASPWLHTRFPGEGIFASSKPTLTEKFAPPSQPPIIPRPQSRHQERAKSSKSFSPCS